MNQKEVESAVFEILANSITARNSDKFLILKMMEREGKVTVQKDYTQNPPAYFISLRLDKWEDFPNCESITRARRKIQAGGQFIPTSEEVRSRRKKREVDFRTLYSR